MITVVCGGILGGVLGAIISVPIVAVGRSVLKQVRQRRSAPGASQP